MAHTFVIRFGRSEGLAGLLEAPGNSYRWKGSGRLSIDAQGISIALKLSLLSLLVRRRSQRIPAESIKEVYREGEALRVEFATEENPRAVLPFWARDRDTAAQIVQLLPTSRTFELEHDADDPRKRLARRTSLMLAAAVVLIGAFAALFITLQRPAMEVPPVVDARPAMDVPSIGDAPSEVDAPPTATSTATSPEVTPASPIDAAPSIEGSDPVPPATSATPRKSVSEANRLITPDEARLLAILAEDPVDWTSPPPTSRRAAAEASTRAARLARAFPAIEPEVEGFVPMEIPGLELREPEFVVPIPQTTLAYDSARDLLKLFESEAADLSEGYGRERERAANGDLNALTFADRLDEYELRWRKLIERVLQDKKFSDPALTGLRATLLSVVISQRVFLSGYAAGIRNGDQDRIDRAFEELARAEERLARARQYVN